MDIGILLWNTCNARCAHCAVSSAPDQARQMSTRDIKSIIDGAFSDSSSPSIGLSGGEAFYFFDDLLEIITYATSKGAAVAINTNCYWATTYAEARRIVELLTTARVSKLVASTDTFHKKYISESCVINAIEACTDCHLEIDVQYVATNKTERLHNFLERHASRFVNVSCREIPCHPVGRAENIDPRTLLTQKGVPSGRCPNAVLSVSADGRYIPCCNTAGHLPALELGRLGQDQTEVFDRFINSPTMSFLWAKGPVGFLPVAVENGYEIDPNGYVDQCHLCFQLFRDEEIARKLKSSAEEWGVDKLHSLYKEKLAAFPDSRDAQNI